MKKQYERLSSLALATVLAIGVIFIWYIAAEFVVDIVLEHLPSPGGSYESMQILRDGTPAIGSYSTAAEQWKYRTLEGKPIPTLKNRTMDWIPNRFDFHWNDQFTYSPTEKAWLFAPIECRVSPSCKLNWEDRIDDVPSGVTLGKHGENWFFLRSERLSGTAYLVGYDCETKRRIGYIGRRGFSADEPPEDERFRVGGSGVRGTRMFPDYTTGTTDRGEDIYVATAAIYLFSSDGMFRIDTKARTSELMLDDADLCAATWINEASDSARELPPKRFLAVRASDRVILIDVAGRLVRTYPLPPEISRRDFSWHELGGGKALVIIPAEDWRGSPNKWDLYWLETGKKSVRHKQIALQSQPWRDIFLVSSIPVLAAPWHLLMILNGGEESNKDIQSTVDWIEKKWLRLALTIALFGVPIWLCYRRQRRFGMPWTWMWVIFVLLLGVPGWLGYLAHRRWPTRSPCPNCDKPTPRDRPACLHCGQYFPVPAPTGAEVFA